MALGNKKPGFEHVESWVFDLDNTLYPSSSRLFDQIDERMGSYISSLLSIDRVKARKIQKDYFYQYGTTLAGLMKEHQVEPSDFLSYVHDIDHAGIADNPELIKAVDALPGRKFICTNGTVRHAENVLNAIGFSGQFSGIFDIVAFKYEPKPARYPYEMMIADADIKPQKSAMFEDIARNLQVPHEMGMVTVLIKDEDNYDGAMINHLDGDATKADYIHHTTDNLAGFLADINQNQGDRK